MSVSVMVFDRDSNKEVIVEFEKIPNVGVTISVFGGTYNMLQLKDYPNYMTEDYMLMVSKKVAA